MPSPKLKPPLTYNSQISNNTREKHPHANDNSIKTWDYAYRDGQALNPPTTLEILASAVQVVSSIIWSHALVSRTFALIFFGCCTNVYSLESILALSPTTGALITAVQFLLIALYKLPSQLTFTTVSPSEPPPLKPTRTHILPRLRSRRIPIREWMLYALQFVLINALNNAAFGYKISLPMHIIIRSAGPVASMLVGWVWTNKRYSPQRTLAVAFLFVGVVVAALFDTSGEGTTPTIRTTSNSTMTNVGQRVDVDVAHTPSFGVSEQAPGFALLTLALFMAAGMGVWCDKLYAKYGRGGAIADEQLFYGHLLALPFFLPQWSALQDQLITLINATSAATKMPSVDTDNAASSTTFVILKNLLPKVWVSTITDHLDVLPAAIPLLFANAITQIACISGVHHLSTQTSALTVSIVLNVRKLVSLLLSIWLFGNNLPLGVAMGAALVFLGGGLYSLPERKADTRPMLRKSDAKREKKSQ